MGSSIPGEPVDISSWVPALEEHPETPHLVAVHRFSPGGFEVHGRYKSGQDRGRAMELLIRVMCFAENAPTLEDGNLPESILVLILEPDEEWDGRRPGFVYCPLYK